MIRAIAALALASATAQPTTPTLISSAPWWEKLTVTIAGDGQPQGCQFESSTKPQAAQTCDVTGGEKATMSSAAGSSSGAKDEYTRITFERRFSPSTQPDLGKLQAGDTLIGGQIMALAIDARGQVKGCKIVAETGSMRPQSWLRRSFGRTVSGESFAHPRTRGLYGGSGLRTLRTRGLNPTSEIRLRGQSNYGCAVPPDIEDSRAQ